jgi:ribosome-binding ATPase YchF (GTP1/OBG family)
MKIALFHVPGIPLGKRNIKDPKLDEANELVEADKRTYAQVDLVGESDLSDADGILCHADAKPDLILTDLEFIETRLSRAPADAERVLLERLRTHLEAEGLIRDAKLYPEDEAILAPYKLLTHKPIVAAKDEELADFDTLLVHAVRTCGHICFLTVGGKENRAWLVRRGVAAVEAASAIHSDLQKGFIRAEVISYEDLVANGGETQAKRAGKMRLEMKDYIVQDCDVISFRSAK